MKNINWKFIFDKFGTIIVDRRFWLTFVFPVVFSIGIFPQLVNADPEALSDQAVAWAELIVGVVVPVLSAFVLTGQWTTRQPSGLRFKAESEVEEFIKQALEK